MVVFYAGDVDAFAVLAAHTRRLHCSAGQVLLDRQLPGRGADAPVASSRSAHQHRWWGTGVDQRDRGPGRCARQTVAMALDEARRRDRDEMGRPRNARPRDRLGRPLPYGSTDSGRPAEGEIRSPEQTLELAQGLLDAGLPFQAHEVFEDAWKLSIGSDRALWKGLAQLAVGSTHLARGNRRGAEALLRRGSAAIAPFRDGRPHGIDVAGLVRWADDLAAALAATTSGPVMVQSITLRVAPD